jgi:hypothetical protein
MSLKFYVYLAQEAEIQTPRMASATSKPSWPEAIVPCNLITKFQYISSIHEQYAIPCAQVGQRVNFLLMER